MPLFGNYQDDFEDISRMSIFGALILLWGVASSRHISFYDDDAAQQPIMTLSQQRRICAELCLSGLGGDPCGDECQDIAPYGLPLQLNNETNNSSTGGLLTRHDACPLLCLNSLGDPLCQCDENAKRKQPHRQDFIKICKFFCDRYDYRLYGCNTCDVYKTETVVPEKFSFSASILTSGTVNDWNVWCQKMCEAGKGGAACYCDLMPMSLQVK